MCQDLAQLSDGYGKEKADVLFASCNTHFYGRVSSSITAERLSRQFGKEDKVYTTASQSRTGFHRTSGTSESVQERDAAKPSSFLSLEPGEFYGIAVESNVPFFRKKFRQAERPIQAQLEKASHTESIQEYTLKVREDIKFILYGQKPEEQEEKQQESEIQSEVKFNGFTIE